MCMLVMILFLIVVIEIDFIRLLQRSFVRLSRKRRWLLERQNVPRRAREVKRDHKRTATVT